MLKSKMCMGTILSLLLFVHLATFVWPQDWPQWRGPHRDGKAQSFVAPAPWPETLTQIWRVALGPGDASPALVGDRLYVFSRQGEEEVLTCLNVADGTQIWQDKVPTPAVTGPASRHPGPRSSPAVAEGKIVTLGVTGVVSCYEAQTGRLLWRKDPFPGITPRFYTSFSPLIVQGMAIVHVGGPGNGAMIAFDVNTGEEKWRWADEGPEYASCVLMECAGTQQIVSLTEKSLVGLNLTDGKLLWQTPFIPSGRAYNSATPIVEGQIVYVTGSQRGTRALRIDRQGEAFSVTELWANPDIACQFSTPILKDGFLYGHSDKGNLFCLNVQTGQIAWLDTNVTDRGSFCPLVDVGSAILALPSSGELIIIKPDSSALQIVARYKVAEAPVYSHPVAQDKKIIIKDESVVTCWALP